MFKCTVTFLELQFVNHTDHLGNLVIFHRGQLKRERTGRIHAYLKKKMYSDYKIYGMRHSTGTMDTVHILMLTQLHMYLLIYILKLKKVKEVEITAVTAN